MWFSYRYITSLSHKTLWKLQPFATLDETTAKRNALLKFDLSCLYYTTTGLGRRLVFHRWFLATLEGLIKLCSGYSKYFTTLLSSRPHRLSLPSFSSLHCYSCLKKRASSPDTRYIGASRRGAGPVAAASHSLSFFPLLPSTAGAC